jgi:hypothetical protein
VITAVHDRPYVPERLCGVIKKEIRVLERIDITQPKYGAKGYVFRDVRVSGTLPGSGDKVHLSLTLPQYAVVRGKQAVSSVSADKGREGNHSFIYIYILSL